MSKKGNLENIKYTNLIFLLSSCGLHLSLLNSRSQCFVGLGGELVALRMHMLITEHSRDPSEGPAGSLSGSVVHNRGALLQHGESNLFRASPMRISSDAPIKGHLTGPTTVRASGVRRRQYN